ncbi:SMI1/KNR4 family protein [Listeria welshimeri]|nr:SMI1/KNR4 family protein [Listeria welshimeri]MBC2358574.1 SMI1/KNR4 family protein [Listeria welshimeri]
MSAVEKNFPEQILKRYVNLLDVFKTFYEQLNLCSNAFEQMSLEAAEGDKDLENKVKLFWNAHLPIMMSVDGCYEYYAIALNDGSVVHGSEPEFEESLVVADSFANFLLKIVAGEIGIS